MECNEIMSLNDLYNLDDNTFEDKYQCKYPELMTHKPITIRDWLKIKNLDGTFRCVKDVLEDISNHFWSDESVPITELPRQCYDFDDPTSIYDFYINREK